MTRLLDDPRLRTPAMMYLFHQVDERLDGTPRSLWSARGGRRWMMRCLVARIRDWEKTIRKRNGIVGCDPERQRCALEPDRRGNCGAGRDAGVHRQPQGRGRRLYARFRPDRAKFELVRTLRPTMPAAPSSSMGGDWWWCGSIWRARRGSADRAVGPSARVRLFDGSARGTGDDPAKWLPELMKVASSVISLDSPTVTETRIWPAQGTREGAMQAYSDRQRRCAGPNSSNQQVAAGRPPTASRRLHRATSPRCTLLVGERPAAIRWSESRRSRF